MDERLTAEARATIRARAYVHTRCPETDRLGCPICVIRDLVEEVEAAERERDAAFERLDDMVATELARNNLRDAAEAQARREALAWAADLVQRRHWEWSAQATRLRTSGDQWTPEHSRVVSIAEARADETGYLAETIRAGHEETARDG